MKIFIELPTWLGDGVMTSMAIESLKENFPNAKFTFFGSFASTSLYQNHPNLDKIIVDKSKNSRFRYLNLAKTIKSLDKFDLGVSFRSHFATKFAFLFLKTDKKIFFKKEKNSLHQAEKYLSFINKNLNLTTKFNELKLYFTPRKFSKKTIGLNPGANYGSAKRWYPAYFAEVGLALKDEYDIIIFAIAVEIAAKRRRRCRPWLNVLSAAKKLLSVFRFLTHTDAATELGSPMLRRLRQS